MGLILKLLRKIFGVHSPHDEWTDIYKKGVLQNGNR